MSDAPTMESLDPVAQALADAIRANAGRPVAMRFTVDGEVLVMHVDGNEVDIPLEVDELEAPPQRFTDEHKDVMGIVLAAVEDIKSKGRAVPLTRKELFQFGARPKAVDQLERWGYLKTRIVNFDKQEGKLRHPAVNVCYFTPKGRAYVRAEFDPGYGLAEGLGPGRGAEGPRA